MTDPIYSDETAARKHLEKIRWQDGAYCPHCGDLTNVKALGGKAAEKGLWHCGSCRKKFTVTVGTVFERSHIPLTKWLAAFHLMCSSKKGISAHQVHRTLNITYKSAWFMCHRIREAMKAGGVVPPPLGGKGKHVEADETFIGRKAGAVMGRGGVAHKRTVLSLVERGGEVRSFHIDRATVSEIVPHMAKHLDIESTLNTDEAKRFVGIGRTFKGGHQAVDHSVKEYARDTAHTNTLEGYFSIFKKGMRGVYQHCDERHLHRYLAEFDFRYSNRAKLGVDDNARTRKVLRGISCKCLTYVQAH
ncbi:IS1595 family transposase [Reyranella sp.]|uniref:IS1595 family transposase n=1 Tax=Reyranella sp. TaxID=1929291 RepID=UPI003BADAA6A